jgi:hypothetical protein
MRKLAWGVLLALLLMAGLGCGGEGNSSRPASESAARGTSSATTATSTPTPGTTPRRKKRSTTKSKATKVATAPSPPPAANPAVFVACDPNIRVKAATTTCPFAQNVFYEYFRDTAGYVSATTVRAWSPAARRFFSVACAGRKPITCTAGDGAEVRFSAEAMEAYDDSLKPSGTHQRTTQATQPRRVARPKTRDRTDPTTSIPARRQPRTSVRHTIASRTTTRVRAQPSNAQTGPGRIPVGAPAPAPGTAASDRSVRRLEDGDKRRTARRISSER